MASFQHKTIAERRETFLPLRGMPQSLMAVALCGLIACSELTAISVDPETIEQAETEGFQDAFPDDVPGLELPNVDAALAKARLGKVQSVHVDHGGRRYAIELSNGNYVYVTVPDNSVDGQRFVSTLKTIQTEPIYVTDWNSKVTGVAQTIGAIVAAIPLLLMLFMIGFLALMIKRMPRSAPKKWDPVESKIRFNDVRGNKEIIRLLKDVVTFMHAKGKSPLSKHLPKGVLLYGPPGNGKTLMAQAIAGEAGVSMILASGSDFVEMFVGVGASRIRDMFASARKHEPCIIFIDEFEALGKKRGGLQNTEHDQTLTQLLVEMDGFVKSTQIMVLAGTNRPDVLDGAVTRPGRFDFKIPVDRPRTVEQRADIADAHLSPLQQEGVVDAGITAQQIAIATPGFSGAMIADVLHKAALHAARRKAVQITPDDVNEAISQVQAGIRSDVIPREEDRQVVAYHEFAGHYLIARLLGVGVSKISTVPRGETLGHVAFTDNDESLLGDQRKLLRMLLVTLGGRAAENIFAGGPTLGANNDIQKARQIIRELLTANMLGYTMNDYSEPHVELDKKDHARAEKLFEVAQDTANQMVAAFDRAEIDAMIGDVFVRQEIAGSEANDLAEKSLNPDTWQRAQAIAEAFLANPLRSDDQQTKPA